jgi:NADPH2:quinone reductase
MAATYRAVMLTKKGGPEGLLTVELPIEPPGPGQLRVQVRAAGVGATDLIILGGNYSFAPKIPLVPGYEAAGVIDAIGTGVTGFEIGQRVAALTVYGSFAELLVREAQHFVPIPDGVSDRDAAAVILNYGTAWQMIHRTVQVQPGQTALVTGASGGVGTAALQLLRLAGVRTYGAASAAKHGIVRSLGAIPIDYRAGPVDRLTRALEPAGVDYVIDAVGGPNIGPCIGALRRGRDTRRIRFHGRARNALPDRHVREYLCWVAPARAAGHILRNHHAIPQRSPAIARGFGHNLRAPRGKEDRSFDHPHLPAP